VKKTAVVILNYNGRHFLKEYLPHLIKYTSDADLIVADNGSTDDSREFLRNYYPNIDIIRLDKNYGFTGGYNRAIRQIKNELIVLLNSDVRVTENWLAPLINTLESDPSIAMVQPKILNERENKLFDYAGASGGFIDRYGYPFCRGRIFDKIEEDINQYDNIQEVAWATGAALLIRREIYERAGGLDEDFFAHMEEIDLAWRLRNAGYKIMVQPESTIYHVGGGTLDKISPFKTYLNFRNSLFVLLKNVKGQRLPGKLIVRLCLDGIAGLNYLIKGEGKHFKAILKAHRNFYKHLFYFWDKRKKTKLITEKLRIGDENNSGVYPHSIVWSYFGKKLTTFNRLRFNNN